MLEKSDLDRLSSRSQNVLYFADLAREALPCWQENNLVVTVTLARYLTESAPETTGFSRVGVSISS
jgi:hypothetical protein